MLLCSRAEGNKVDETRLGSAETGAGQQSRRQYRQRKKLLDSKSWF